MLIILPLIGTILPLVGALIFYRGASSEAVGPPASMAAAPAPVRRISAGNLVTICGQTPQADGGEPQRFLALQVSPQRRMEEPSTPNFDVLWARLCAAAAPGW
ncbi:hypothetical protein Acid7E03_26690 [Acidisoma sp. 7E03]